MVTIEVKNINGQTILPAAGSTLAAGYDVVTVDNPIIEGDSVVINGVTYYNRIDYIEYRTALYISPQPGNTVNSSGRETYHALLHPRSSVRKYNLLLANSIGLIDTDYRGELLFCYKYIWQPEDCSLVKEKAGPVQQTSDTTWIQEYDYKMLWKPNMNKIYKKGDKVGQIVTEKNNPTEYVFVDELDSTERGNGGFGSTDKNQMMRVGSNTKSLKIIGELPSTHTAPNVESKDISSNIISRYQKDGGLQVKRKYIDEVKERDQI